VTRQRESTQAQSRALSYNAQFTAILTVVLLRRAFLISSVTWAACLPLSALAASRPDAPSALYGFAVVAYSVGHLICHQLSARSFHLWGASLPVCARCTGIYLGAAAASVVLGLAPGRLSSDARGAKENARLVLLIALVPTAATLAFEWTTGITPANWIRALAGLPLGVAVAWAVGMVN
jgi:uncharacterized membrane protein